MRFSMETTVMLLVMLLVPAGRAFTGGEGFYLKVLQHGKYTEVHDMDQVTLRKDEFSLLFPLSNHDFYESPGHYILLTAFVHKMIFNIREGQGLNSIYFFQEGSGFACGSSGYDVLAICSEGTHYIIYDENDPGNRRAALVNKITGSRFEVRWDIRKIAYHVSPFREYEKIILGKVVRGGLKCDGPNINDENTFSVAEFPGNVIYIAVFSDMNDNRIVDSGELIRAEIRFKTPEE